MPKMSLGLNRLAGERPIGPAAFFLFGGAAGMSLPVTYQRSVRGPRMLFRVPEHAPQLG